MGANNSTFKDEQAMEYDIQSPSDPMKDELTLTRKKLNIYRSTLNECAMECLKSGKPLGEDAELLALSRAIDELILQIKRLEHYLEQQKDRSEGFVASASTPCSAPAQEASG